MIFDLVGCNESDSDDDSDSEPDLGTDDFDQTENSDITNTSDDQASVHSDSENLDSALKQLCGIITYRMRNVDKSLSASTETSVPKKTKHMDRLFSGIYRIALLLVFLGFY